MLIMTLPGKLLCMLAIVVMLFTTTSSVHPSKFSEMPTRKYTPIDKDGERVSPQSVEAEKLFDEQTNLTFRHSSKTSQVRVTIDTEKILRTTNAKFLSVAIDSNIIKERWKTFDFTSERLKTLAKALSPCYIRLGGTEEDYLLFNESTYNEDFLVSRPKNFTNFTMTVDDWDNINQFSQKVGWNLIFGLNVLLRNHDNRWDYSNAMDLINYTIKQGYHVDWELGNEPNSFRKTAGKALDANILAEDFRTLQGILQSRTELRNCLLAGPDITSSGIEKYLEVDIHPGKYLDSFLKAGPNVTNVTTWHQYYVDGKIAVLDNFTDPNILNMLVGEIEKVKEIVNRYKPGTSIWLGETSSAYGGGAPNLSDRYVAGFMWLDKLGVSAVNGLDLVIRQEFYHGHYALIDDDLDPLPDYWLSVLYKRLVGSKVLGVEVMNSDIYSPDKMTLNNSNNGRVRVYAHCTHSTNYPIGSITMYVISLYKERTTEIVLSGEMSKLAVDEYLLTPHGDKALISKKVNLNDKELKMLNNYTLPDFIPRRLQPGKSIVLPPLSFGFYVIVDAKANACM